nr:MAG TPA_asm: hypothetical protein [Caudoviricetes sp.]
MAFTNPLPFIHIGCSLVNFVVLNDPYGFISNMGSFTLSYLCRFFISTNLFSLLSNLSSSVTSSTFTSPLFVTTFSPGVKHPPIYKPCGGSFTGYSHITTDP